MKISSELSHSYCACFDEARGIAMNKKTVLKNRNPKCISYLQMKLLTFILLIVLAILLAGISYLSICFYIFSLLLILIATVYFIISIFLILSLYTYRLKWQTNKVLMNKTGISGETCYGIKYSFKWDLITAVVIGKYSVTILTDTPCYFYFDISKKDEIIKAIEKYDNKNKIIK